MLPTLAMAAPSLVGQNIKRIREALGWSRGVLASKAGCTPQMLLYLERGDRRWPSEDMTHAIAQAFGVDVAELFREAAS